jgi:aspartate-semialdehyde dehydrogenase
MSSRRKRKVAVLGATGTVGQRFVSLLANHPWFELAVLTTSERNAGKRYADAVHWHLPEPIPDAARDLTLAPTAGDLAADLCFSALPHEAAVEWEAALAKTGHHVFSNVKTHRMDDDVPLVIAEVNADHLDALRAQRKRRGYSGSIVANGNCSAIGFSLATAPLQRTFGIERATVTTLQALSGAGYPGVASLDGLDNVVPFIGEEEEKLVEESRKFLGGWDGSRFAPATFAMSASCNRVPVRDGHTEIISVALRGSPAIVDVVAALRAFRGKPQELALPTAPRCPVIVRDEPDRPQPVLDRDAERGMAVSVGRVRADPVLGVTFVALSHNVVRGAAGASVLNAELAVAEQLV